MAKKKLISVPIHLLKLLMCEREDMKDPDTYDDVRELAKASANLLIKASE